jgi:hypothetical protein
LGIKDREIADYMALLYRERRVIRKKKRALRSTV